jgi:hypothetical protein
MQKSRPEKVQFTSFPVKPEVQIESEIDLVALISMFESV